MAVQGAVAANGAWNDWRRRCIPEESRILAADSYGEDSRKMRYRVHRFGMRMTSDQRKLEEFLNGLKGEVIAVVPNVTLGFFWAHRVDFVLVVEKVG